MRAAVADLVKEGVKCELVTEGPGASTFRTYPGESPRCDAVIKFANGRYDIGLVKKSDGSYTPRFDPYSDITSQGMQAPHAAELVCELSGSRDSQYAQRAIGKLMQFYSANIIERQAARAGKRTTREWDKAKAQLNVVVSGY